jgi:hypothetical protein
VFPPNPSLTIENLGWNTRKPSRQIIKHTKKTGRVTEVVYPILRESQPSITRPEGIDRQISSGEACLSLLAQLTLCFYFLFFYILFFYKLIISSSLFQLFTFEILDFNDFFDGFGSCLG